MTKPLGYIVVDRAEDWEQPLCLRHDAGMPEAGILHWCEWPGDHIAVFPSRADARAAITRTQHWGRAHEQPSMWPSRVHCVVLSVAAAKGGTR